MPPRKNAQQAARNAQLPPPVPPTAAASASTTSTAASSSSSSSSSAPSAALLAAQGKERAQETAHGIAGAVDSLWTNYLHHTPARMKLIDCFMFFLMLTGVIQFVYCFAITNYPFNAFIAGFAATVGQFVLCGALRIQSNTDNKPTFPLLSPERAFGDFVFGSVLLHFFVWCYLG